MVKRFPLARRGTVRRPMVDRRKPHRSKTMAKYALTVKVSTKGAVQVNGMGRWPVTLYPDQMEALLAAKDGILKFIAANKDKFASKETSPTAEGTVRLS